MDYRVYVEQTTHTWTDIEADSPEEVVEIVESGDYPTKDVHVDGQLIRVYFEGNIPLVDTSKED